MFRLLFCNNLNKFALFLSCSLTIYGIYFIINCDRYFKNITNYLSEVLL